MKSKITKIKHFLQRFVWRFIPSKIPTGVTALEDFSNNILDTYQIPNLPSYHHAIAAMIMHLGPTQSTVTKHHVAQSLRKAMSNQICFQRIQDLKELEKEKQVEAVSDAEPTQV